MIAHGGVPEAPPWDFTQLRFPAVMQEWLPDDRGGSKLNFEAVIITSYLPTSKTHKLDMIGDAWRRVGEDWVFNQGFFDSKTLKPHPDPDRVWAEYCAAVLVNEGAKS